MNHHHLDKEDLNRRLNKIRGQVEGINKLIAQDKDCVSIINQCKAVKGAISKVQELVLESHLRSCVVAAIKSGNDNGVIEDILSIYKLTPQER